ncbi:MAG TPA: hypothetical protein VNW51_08930 [Mucilaginibacter sp.]|jgi:hypothetical protein|nr:hypothetical protein [Mucilaginibacter sp.]
MATPVPLNFGRDMQGYNAFAPQPSTIKYKATLTANAATSVVVPSSSPSWIVSFRYSPNNVWVNFTGATAATPTGATLTATTDEMNPASVRLTSGTTISMITSQTTADVSVVMWPDNAYA